MWTQTLASSVALEVWCFYIQLHSENGEKKDTRCADPEHEFRPKMGISRAKVVKFSDLIINVHFEDVFQIYSSMLGNITG